MPTWCWYDILWVRPAVHLVQLVLKQDKQLAAAAAKVAAFVWPAWSHLVGSSMWQATLKETILIYQVDDNDERDMAQSLDAMAIVNGVLYHCLLVSALQDWGKLSNNSSLTPKSHLSKAALTL